MRSWPLEGGDRTAEPEGGERTAFFGLGHPGGATWAVSVAANSTFVGAVGDPAGFCE